MKKNKRLIPGEKYYLQRTGQFCHYMTKDGIKSFSEGYAKQCVFIGDLGLITGNRNIFYYLDDDAYIMFGTSNLDYVIDIENKEILQKINELKEKINDLEESLKLK